MILNDHDLFLHSDCMKELKKYKTKANFEKIIFKYNEIMKNK